MIGDGTVTYAVKIFTQHRSLLKKETSLRDGVKPWQYPIVETNDTKYFPFRGTNCAEIDLMVLIKRVKSVYKCGKNDHLVCAADLNIYKPTN
jgi:hypothetical protein